ncbi:MAG: sugar phosphate isomerase/epimerase, partial [Phycisphaerales bacterium]|nr:sugar phosphate isomerase/epimerase [Phycisphaerales bacterium]
RRLAAADAPASPAGEYAGLKFGIQSYSLRDRPFDKALAALKDDLKLKFIEVYPNHLTGRSPDQVKEMLAAAGVAMTSYGVVPFKKDDAANRKLFELARTYGLKTLACDPDDNKETFDSLEKLTEEFGVPVAIHPHGPAHKWGKVEQLKKAFDGRSPRIGLCADTGHLIRAGEDPLKVCELFKDRLHSLHLKDFKKLDTKDKQGNDNWEDVPAGTANLDVDGLVKLLVGLKFAGHVYIEYEGKKPVESIEQSLARVREAAKKATA